MVLTSLALLAVAVWPQLSARFTGDEVVLRVQPVDPIDPFRGAYVDLGYPEAMQMLKAKLYLLKQEANAEKLSDIRGEVKEIGWGNQIRSYVLQPYTLVKDHRHRCGDR